ncbi:hypothetical protein NLG97_g1447 [Lecanicillium saksenae]|uniref:Uncharacterized protein n=1 Tax=Lecanicillium saksenae TaxID=468837 RepID=A0ACC1R5M5_9HYPO|nr:hypothetical protein NLG97_g1447 [Lecanicillium saksenae]
MHSATLLLLSAVSAHGFRGMANLRSRALEVQDQDSPVLIGDLATLADDRLSSTGNTIKDILAGRALSEELFDHYSSVPDRDSPECKADTCCIWKHIADEMNAKMKGTAGRCNNLARQAVRMGFHDAATWSTGTGTAGGADGSLVLAHECYDRPINKGMESGCDQMQEWFDKYKSYGISMADLIQMAATVGAVTCPLGPRVRSFVGRQDNTNAAPENLLPQPTDSADSLIELFGNKTISPADLVALVGAHTTSQQEFVDPSRAGDPQDSTPGIWDTAFYGQTLNSAAPRRVFKFQSDINLSKDKRTRGTWAGFIGLTGQIPWNLAYAKAYVRLSLLGVYNINNLTECSKALPLQLSAFTSPDAKALDKFAEGGLPNAVELAIQGDVIPLTG